MSAAVAAAPDLEGRIREALGTIQDPCSVRNRTPLSLLDMGIVEAIAVDDAGHAIVTMLLTDPGCVFFFEMGREITERVSAIPGISKVEVQSIGDRWWEPERMAPAARRRLEQMRAERDARVRAIRLGRKVGADAAQVEAAA